MINIIKFIFLLLLSITYISCNDNQDEEPQPQTALPNANFEIWLTDDIFEKPESWGTSNFSLFNIVTFNTVVKDETSAYEGTYSVKLETKSQIIDNQPVSVVGLITLGSFDINIVSKQAQISGGMPFISKPIALEGYFKYVGVGIDSCFVDIAITKFNTQLLKQDTIAAGRFSSASVAAWTQFSIPIKYYSNEIPDSMNIVILSSDTSIFESGSTLWIDNLSLKY